MIRLAMAVGFLTVFGLVGYALILLLANHFQSKKENESNKPNN